ncbi:hypothetical protein [Sporosarcina pasteurii]|uniref:Uncharacterized protein n=1 Tax=Sporosarcina pasteurii TaxID=1474 RepID=A0A380BCZ4_SPOPA|nr:hypothetical protein [Sporosarcina pasteurii]MDS9473270.1 hypothetical protein [Sporosarcina pasteurii]QBQ06502.1 hypothetical protein E2C16_12970 [Sporosarcina pasteurii]SUI98315.1 Uncharacterised protein [Sporosarcina pasteurii]
MAKPVAIDNGGGGAAPLIEINPDEITTIYNHLQEIITELESNVVPNVEKIGELNYYTAGKAEKAMEVYAEANTKILELQDHYVRASTLVIDILNTMLQTDAEVAEKIIAKLKV